MVTQIKWSEIEQSLDAILPKPEKNSFRKVQTLPQKRLLTELELMKCQTQLESVANEDASINSLNQRKPKTEQTRKQQNERTRNKEVPSKECHKFGCKHGNKKCYAKGKRCTKCQKLNHFARVCRSKPDTRKGVHLLEEEDSDDELFVGCIVSINTVELSGGHDKLTVQNKAVKFQLDTGAKCNVLPYKIIEDLGIQCHVEKTQIKLKSHSEVINFLLEEQ